MGLLTVSRDIPEPVEPAKKEHLSHFSAQLRAVGYDIPHCAKSLGVFPRLGVSFWPAMRIAWAPNHADPVDTLISLFIDGEETEIDHLVAQTSSPFVDVALEMRLIDRAGPNLRSNICLLPAYGSYFVTDRPEKNTAINQVMWLWGESYILGGIIKRSPRKRTIDLGTGSGIHAILASNHCETVIGADVNPRAISFSRFNAELNGLHNVEFVLSDLFEKIDGTHDLLLANPPYAPDWAAEPGDNFWSGGPDGFAIMGRIIHALPTRLAHDGTAHVIGLYPNPVGTTTRDNFNIWLGGKLAEWDVLDHTWPVPKYEDMLSDKPFDGDKSAWRFGVVSLRRSRHATGWWKDAAGRGVFFSNDGSCRMVADHDAQ